MPSKNKQLKMWNLNGYLSQINSNSGPDTIIKIKSKGANCLFKTGNKQNIKKAIKLYTEAHSIQSNIRGQYHPRTLDILNFIIRCEKRLEQIKKNNKSN
jgi:hypothetical protein